MSSSTRSSAIGLTSPAAVAAYAAVVAAVVGFQHLGWNPAYLVAALLLLPWLSEHGTRGTEPSRPRWWVGHAISASTLVVLAATAVAVQRSLGPWATPALVLVLPLTPVLLPAYGLIGSPWLGGPLPHLPAAVAIMSPVYGLLVHRLRLRRWDQRQRRLRVARRRIRAALRSGTVGTPEDGLEEPLSDELAAPPR